MRLRLSIIFCWVLVACTVAPPPRFTGGSDPRGSGLAKSY